MHENYIQFLNDERSHSFAPFSCFIIVQVPSGPGFQIRSKILTVTIAGELNLKQLSALQVNPEEDWLAISSFSYFLLRGRIIYSMSFEFEAYGTKPQSQRGSF